MLIIPIIDVLTVVHLQVVHELLAFNFVLITIIKRYP